MSVTTEIQRIQGLVSQLRTNITNKGVQVPAGADLEDCVDYVNQISGGGVQPGPYESEYFTLEATNGNVTLRSAHINTSSLSDATISTGNSSGFQAFHWYVDYSFDKVTWTTVDVYTSSYSASSPDICTIPNGSKVYLRSTSNRIALKGVSSSAYAYNLKCFNAGSGSLTVSGNIMSLVYGDDFIGKTFNQEYQFAYLFVDGAGVVKDISNLVLPSSTSKYGYRCMFWMNTSFTTAPELPATTLTENCYYHMFYKNHLTTAPSLPATKLVQSCYSEMFYQCTSLTTPPTLSSTSLAANCYSSMFYGCTSLSSAPNLPAATLANNCYNGMFRGCSSLTTLPTISATTLAVGCYQNMFYGCPIASIPSDYLPITTLAQNCYNGMFYEAQGFTTPPNLPATTLAQSCYGNMFASTLITSLPTISATTLAQSCYSGMFSGCLNLTTVPSDYLPITTLQNSCYSAMFKGCWALTSVPNLPATTLAQSCYTSMFEGCSGLTTLPSNYLQATTLATYCYESMFKSCSGLTTAPKLPATTLQQRCYDYMFQSCTSLTTVPSDMLPATTLQTGCYQYMFSGCTSLTTAPVLPATALVSTCYTQMFYGCTNLNYVKAMFTTTPSNTYSASWLQNVSSTGTFVKNSAATWTTTGVNAVPTGWTIQYESAA